MIEKETAVPRERRLVAAVIYNRLQKPDAARDRRDDPVRARHPRHGVADEGSAPLDVALQHAPASRPAADADREPGPRLDRAQPRTRRATSTTSTTSASRSRSRTTSPRARATSPQGLRVRLRLRLSARARRGGARLAVSGRALAPARPTCRTRPWSEFGGLALRVEPLGRQELAPCALVLATGLEPSEKPPVDVVGAHRRAVSAHPGAGLRVNSSPPHLRARSRKRLGTVIRPVEAVP